MRQYGILKECPTDMMKRRGFVIIIVMAFLTVLVLIAWAIVDIGCGEILQTKARNDSLAAYYAAAAGAEMMYAKLNTSLVTLPVTLTGDLMTRSSGGQTVGTFAVTADTSTVDIVGVASEGTVRGHKARVTVKYKFAPAYLNGSPFGSLGPMTLYGQKWWIFKSYVRSNSDIVTGGTVTKNSYVQITGSISQNQPIETPSFWWKYDIASNNWSPKSRYDTHGTGNPAAYITDVNGDGKVTTADIQPGQDAIFISNDINGDGEVNDKDAFITYYTEELNKQNLGLASGQSNHYEGTQTFGPGDVPSGKDIIFVNGDVNILYNDQNWSSGACDHTIVSTGNITIIQPINGTDDRLTLVSYGDVNTGGINLFGSVKGNIDVYANGDFNAYYGGTSNGTILAKDSVYVNTVLPIPAFLNRNLNKGTDNWWNDPAKVPLGLPQRYNAIPATNTTLAEAQDPIWEKG
mgnify:CR=1 FL=1